MKLLNVGQILIRQLKQHWPLLWLFLLAAAALLSLLLELPSPPTVDLEHIAEPPSLAHWLGTDPFGRDVLADLVYGTHSLLLVSMPAASLTSLLGIILGGAAGFWGNHGLRVPRSAVLLLLSCFVGCLLTSVDALPWWFGCGLLALGPILLLPYHKHYLPLPLDQLVQLCAAALGSIPRLFLILALAAIHPASSGWLLLILAFTCWTSTARLVRVSFLQIRHQAYIEAARATGISKRRLFWHHLMPNAWPALRAILPLNLAACIGLQTTLSFLGIGIPPDQSDWGRTLTNARHDLTAWWLILTAASVLFLTIIALQSLLPTSRRSAKTDSA